MRPRPGPQTRGADYAAVSWRLSAGNGWREDADHADPLLPARRVRGNPDLQDPRPARLDHDRDRDELTDRHLAEAARDCIRAGARALVGRDGDERGLGGE